APATHQNSTLSLHDALPISSPTPSVTAAEIVTPVAVNICGLPLAPREAANSVFAPSPNVHDPTVAIPLASLTGDGPVIEPLPGRSEEHTSELQSVAISYAVF